jgi:hypothetical protein
MDGTVIGVRGDENARFYGERVGVDGILSGSVGRWTGLEEVVGDIERGFLDRKVRPHFMEAPVLLEFEDRRGQTKGKDGVWVKRDEKRYDEKGVDYRDDKVSDLAWWRSKKIYIIILMRKWLLRIDLRKRRLMIGNGKMRSASMIWTSRKHPRRRRTIMESGKTQEDFMIWKRRMVLRRRLTAFHDTTLGFESGVWHWDRLIFTCIST